jgi:hypothetical protein
MKSIHKLVASAACATTLLAAAMQVAAVDAPRNDMVTSAGACVPANRTDDVVYRVGGVRNSGTEPIFVVCGMQADWRGSPEYDNATEVAITVTNKGTDIVDTTCTLFAGYSYSEEGTSGGSFPEFAELTPGEVREFLFDPVDLLGEGAEFGTPTFLCSIGPKVEINFVRRNFAERVGS